MKYLVAAAMVLVLTVSANAQCVNGQCAVPTRFVSAKVVNYPVIPERSFSLPPECLCLNCKCAAQAAPVYQQSVQEAGEVRERTGPIRQLVGRIFRR